MKNDFYGRNKKSLERFKGISCPDVEEILNDRTFTAEIAGRGDEEEERSFIECCKKYGMYSTVIVCGFGNGILIRKLLRMINDNELIIVYEPYVNAFDSIIREQDVTDILNNLNLYLCLGDGKTLKDSLISLIPDGAIDKVHAMVLPDRSGAYREAEQYFRDVTDKALDAVRLRKYTFDFGRDAGERNFFAALPKIADSYDLQAFVDIAERFFNEKDIPAIIVAAGPSLERNIGSLKAAEGKAFIIAVDSALFRLEEEGIEYNLAVTVDRIKPLRLFGGNYFRHVPVLMNCMTPADVIERSEGICFFESTGQYSDVIDMICEEADVPRLMRFPTGGSVACTAWSLAVKMRFKTIIWAGLDLAYTENASHINGYFEDTRKDEEFLLQHGNVFVKDVKGNTVPTGTDMKSYLEWFNSEFINHPEINIIDATEGGAAKEGVEYLTLADAVKKYCSYDSYTDFKSLFEQVKKFFSDNQKKFFLKRVEDMAHEADALIPEFDEYITAYRTVGECLRRHDTNSDEFVSAYEITKKASVVEVYHPILLRLLREMEGSSDSMYDENIPIEQVMEDTAVLLEKYRSACTRVIDYCSGI